MSRRQVELVCWAHEHGHMRLARTIQFWWRVRNWFRDSGPGMWLETRWLRVKYAFHPRCEKCGAVIFYEECFMCRLRQKIEVGRLKP